MKLLVSASFQRCIKSLDNEDKARVFEAMKSVNAHYGNPHRHSGAGIRRIGKVMECRDALSKRLLFVCENDALLFLYYGDHDEVKKYARNYRA